MTLDDLSAVLWLAVPMFIIGGSGLYMLHDAASCPDDKRPLRIFGAALSWYLLIIYGAALLNYRPDFIITGQATRIGITLTFLALALEIRSSRRGEHVK
jgi:hypothetical protein